MTEEELTQFADDLGEAKADSDIDGYGDEGSGYDFTVMAKLLLEKYTITPKPEANHDGH